MRDDDIFYPPTLADTAMQNNILHKLICMLLKSKNDLLQFSKCLIAFLARFKSINLKINVKQL
jgi:hypothetical protein